MQLKEIDIRGFKSFPDRTVIGFEDGITAIVGPNGSGKSNISDAVRWVLGEQSIKSLRGSSMKDIIFAGTSKRKPLGYAEVTITFDNKSGQIPVDYNEVAITRRVFRSGESEYYINKNSCRLMDIRELLMDTGIGKEGYSIIGQGKIDEILSTKSEDRRNIFEEAAGIVKYKSKKEESEKKLDRTEKNLVRVNDLLSELSRQEKTLKNQAVKAREYQKLYSELKKLDINVYIDSLGNIKKDLKEIEKNIFKLDEELKKNNILDEEYKNRITKLEEEIDVIIEELDIKKNKKIKLMQRMESEKNNISLLTEQKKFNEKDLRRLNEEREQINSNILKIELEDKKLLNQIEKEKNDLEVYENKQLKDINYLREKNEQIKKIEDNLEELKNRLIDLYNNTSDTKSKLNNILSFNENIDKRLYQLEENIKEETINKDEILKSNKGIKNRKTILEKELLELKNKVQNNQEIIKKKEDEHFKIDSDLNKMNIKIETNLSNYKLYKNMEDSYEGYYYGVKSILKASKTNKVIRDNIIGIIADLINVDRKYELAISTALGGNSQNIVTPTQSAGKIIIDYLRKNNLGRVTCLPLDTIKGRTLNINEQDRRKFNVIGLGSEIIRYDKKYKEIIESLLGRTVIIKDMENGIKLSNKYNNSIRIVTLEGDIINPGGSMTGGSQGRNRNNILSRKNKIERIKIEIKKHKSLKEDLISRKKELNKELNGLNEEYVFFQNKIQSKDYRLIELNNRIKNEDDQIKRIDKSISRSKEEIKSLLEEVENNNKEKNKLEDKIKYLEEELLENRNTIKEKEIKLVEIIEDRDNSSEIVTNSRINLNKKENKINNLNDKYKTNRETINHSKLELEKNKNEQLKIEDEIVKIIKSKEKSKKKIIKLNQEKKEIENKVKIIIRDKEIKDKEYNKLEKKNKEIIEIISKKEKLYNNLELKKAKIEIKKEALKDSLFEKYDITYEELYDYRIKDIDIDNAKSRIKMLTKSIKKLGNINLNSIKEYDDLKTRLDFILEQKSDLDKAREDLEEVISNMEKKMGKMFSETFEEINTNFKIIFRTLFNGGNANLILEDEENILTTGINIEAQPPGKKLQDLTSLSGGERSLVAVSLLFAILKMKPAPFCILDEIDAALDEANIGRYTNYLKKISEETQFVIITHRKKTMEMADVLYGVTMEEEGVSKLLSVELTEYEELVV